MAGPEALGHRGHNFLLRGAVGLQAHHHRQIVIGVVNLVYNFIVKGLRADDAALSQPLLQQGLLQTGMEGPHQAAAAKMDPNRVGQGLLGRGLPVVIRYPDTGLFPGRPILQALIA